MDISEPRFEYNAYNEKDPHTGRWRWWVKRISTGQIVAEGEAVDGKHALRQGVQMRDRLNRIISM